CQQYDSDSLIF
nr:immunoglobulin light chain junction region [Macaca mulatta]